MKFNVSAEMGYEIRSAGTLILNIHALRTPTQAVLEETFTIEPYVKVEELFSVNGENRIIRLEIEETGNLQINYKATVDNDFEIKDHSDREEILIGKMDPLVLPYLYPSRYCQSDKLFRLANNLFGHIANPFEKVVTLTNWINKNVEYRSGSTNAQTSAYDTVTQQTGVCRDFAHLGIALCRALTIPARYFTGYAYQLKPGDFHACFEAYIGGQWIFFDPTKLVPVNGLVKIANGRDAADAAVTSIYGNVSCTSMIVQCDCSDPAFKPYYNNNAENQKGLSYT